MWIGILLAIVLTIAFLSYRRNRDTPFQSSESDNRNYSGDGGTYMSNAYSDPASSGDHHEQDHNNDNETDNDSNSDGDAGGDGDGGSDGGGDGGD